MQLDPDRRPAMQLRDSPGLAKDPRDAPAAPASGDASALGGEGIGALRQLRRLAPALLAVGAATLALVALITWLTLLKESVAITAVFSDPVDATGSRLVGLVSILGVLIWTVALTACALAATMLRARGGASSKVARFFVASAGAVLLLLLDDLLAVHELGIDVLARVTDVSRTTTTRNLTEMAFFLVYAIVVVAYLWRFRSFLRRTEYGLLGLGGALLGTSLALDMAPIDGLIGRLVAEEHVHSVAIWIEELPKLLGIAVVALYFVRVAVGEVARARPKGGSAGRQVAHRLTASADTSE